MNDHLVGVVWGVLDYITLYLCATLLLLSLGYFISPSCAVLDEMVNAPHASSSASRATSKDTSSFVADLQGFS